MTTIYHVFTDSHDEYTSDYEEAKSIFDEFVSDNKRARLYEEKSDIKNDHFEEHCILSVGGFPF